MPRFVPHFAPPPRCGLSGAQLVISDAHEGLRSALAQVFTGATWQRCKVHFLPNVASAVPKLHASAVLAVVKSIFLQPTPETAADAVAHALAVLEPTSRAWPPSCATPRPMCSRISRSRLTTGSRSPRPTPFQRPGER
jgi:hypothetical protein